MVGSQVERRRTWENDIYAPFWGKLSLITENELFTITPLYLQSLSYIMNKFILDLGVL